MSTVLQCKNLFAVEGLIAVITGGGTGIGLMMARALSVNGATAIYLLGNNPGPIEAAAKEAVRIHSSLAYINHTETTRKTCILSPAT